MLFHLADADSSVLWRGIAASGVNALPLFCLAVLFRRFVSFTQVSAL